MKDGDIYQFFFFSSRYFFINSGLSLKTDTIFDKGYTNCFFDVSITSLFWSLAITLANLFKNASASILLDFVTNLKTYVIKYTSKASFRNPCLVIFDISRIFLFLIVYCSRKLNYFTFLSNFYSLRLSVNTFVLVPLLWYDQKRTYSIL